MGVGSHFPSVVPSVYAPPQLAEPAAIVESVSPRYVLHPPLPSTMTDLSRGGGGGGGVTLPILINTEIMLTSAAIFNTPTTQNN